LYIFTRNCVDGNKNAQCSHEMFIEGKYTLRRLTDVIKMNHRYTEDEGGDLIQLARRKVQQSLSTDAETRDPMNSFCLLNV
jgi:hypothetical protein